MKRLVLGEQLVLKFLATSQRDRTLMHSKKKKYFRAPFLVLQVVTNRGLYSVPGRTKWKDHDRHIGVPVGFTLRKKYFRAPFLVLQVVTNIGLYSVPGRTK